MATLLPWFQRGTRKAHSLGAREPKPLDNQHRPIVQARKQKTTRRAGSSGKSQSPDQAVQEQPSNLSWNPKPIDGCRWTTLDNGGGARP
jgi:hypothetical protein